jgi:O-antigen/teichoic acid export membrane protein
LPLLAIFRNLRAILEAYQRFDLVSAVQIPSSSVNLLLPALGAWAGLHLPGIMLLLTASRVMTIAAYAKVSERVVPTFWRRIGFEKHLLPLLFSYGGWVALCDALIPVINYSDRFVIGSVLSVEAMGYYAAPFEAASKALIVPSAIVQSLFPALGTLGVARREQFAKLYANGLKYTLLVMTPLILAVVLFAKNILTLWIGKDFAAKSTLVLQLLAIGMLLNAVSQVACTLLDAVGKPGLRAKVFLAVVAPFLILLVVLTKLFGLNGAAAGWLLGTALHTGWYLLLSRKVLPETIAGYGEHGVHVAAFLTAGCLGAAGVILVIFGGSLLVKSLASMLLLAFFLAAAWWFVFDPATKRQMASVLRRS